MITPYTLDSVRQCALTGTSMQFVFFWRHTPESSVVVTKACLSQWWPAPFVVDGNTYPTAEHYMMAQKARLFGDEHSFNNVLLASHPREARQLGRSVTGFKQLIWVAERCRIVVEANHAKFSQHGDLRAFLLGTGDRVLVEASPFDRIWGIGLAASEPDIENPSRWQGLNLLGFALMTVRDMLSAFANETY
jgi:ribA/ribD-fused uncharacterized protein